MTPTLVCIVEGHGDVAAIPILIRRFATNLHYYDLDVPRPIRCPKSKLIRSTGSVEINEYELDRVIRLAVSKLPSRQAGGILILLDADTMCPAKMGPGILQLAGSIRQDALIRIVVAKREYEAWLIAALESLRGQRGIRNDASSPPSPEEIPDPKGYLTGQMGSGRYSETLDQPALTALFDLSQAERCDSFRKLQRELVSILDHLCRYQDENPPEQ